MMIIYIIYLIRDSYVLTITSLCILLLGSMTVMEFIKTLKLCSASHSEPIIALNWLICYSPLSMSKIVKVIMIGRMVKVCLRSTWDWIFMIPLDSAGFSTSWT